MARAAEARPRRELDLDSSLSGVLLARHGETDYNVERRFQGWLGVALNERGREQARELGERAAEVGFVKLWCSTLERALQTAVIVGSRLGLEPHEDARLAETNTGDWTDRLFADVHDEDPERLEAFLSGDPAFAFPGGESFAQQAERVMEALSEISAGPKPALVICHGVVIRLVLTRLGRHDGPPGTIAPPVPNAALISL